MFRIVPDVKLLLEGTGFQRGHADCGRTTPDGPRGKHSAKPVDALKYNVVYRMARLRLVHFGYSMPV